MDVGALSLLISEKGFDATIAKVAALDAAAAKVGARTAELRVTSPTALAVEAALARVGQTASAISARPAALTLTLTGAQQATAALAGIGEAKAKAETPIVIPVQTPNVGPAEAALAGLDGAKAKAATPVVIPVTRPNIAPAVAGLKGLEQEKQQVSGTPVVVPVVPPNVGPAITQLTALAEAEAIQAQRAAALTTALAAAGAEGVDLSSKVQLLRGAIDEDNSATAQLSQATLQLDRTQRDGIAVIQLRIQALQELRAAQDAVTRSETLASGTTRVIRAPLTGAIPAVPVGPQLGPATAQAEAFAQRTAATAAAFEAEAAAAQKAAVANSAAATGLNAAGAASERISPKLRSAANGLTAVAFAATSSGGSFQSIALGAGLAASSLASMASGPIALWASGIGAALVVAGAFVGILERMSDTAAKTRTALDEVSRSIQGIRSSSEAQSALTVSTRDLAAAELQLAAAQSALGTGGAAGLVGEIFDLRAAQKTADAQREIVRLAQHQIAVTTIKEATDLAAARREIVVQGLEAENAARDAAGKAAVAGDAAQFAVGRESLDQYFKARLALIQSSGAREIEVLKARQKALAEPVPDATPAESAKRAAEIRRIGSQITETESRIREETTQTTDQRRAQRETLDKQILGFETREQEAAGDASEKRIEQARVEAREIARALVQRSGATGPAEIAKAWDDANAAAQQYVATQTAQIRFQQQQTAAQRVFNELELVRLGIQQRLAQGTITEADAQTALAAEERKRIPDLQKIATQMEVFGSILKNPELLNAAKRLRAEITGLALAPLGPLAARVKQLRDELSVAAKEGDKTAAQILARLHQIEASGGKITIGVILEAEWERDIKRQIEEGLTLQTIAIKPKNIVLSGVADAIGQLNQQLSGLATNVGNSIGNALGAGFSAAFTKGSGKNFFEAAGNAIMAGIGSTLVQLGSAMLTYGLLMSVAAPFFIAAGVFTKQAISAPAAIVAGTGLIALGAGLGAIAANNTGTRTGAGAGGRSASGQSSQIAPQQVVFDPDRRLREARAIAPTVTGSTTAKAAPTQQPVVFAPTIIGTNDPKAVRDIGEMVGNALRRNLIPRLTG